MALLSIVVPVFNKAKYIDLCIESILAQTVTDFELILVNDGSKDNSGEKCDQFARKDRRVKVIHQVNRGVSAARNAGLEIATGRYIGFVDSDDTLEKDMYELLLANAGKYHADISICGVRRVFPHKEQLYGGNNMLRLFNKDEGISGLFSGEILMSNYDKIYKYETVKDIRFKPALFEDTYYNFEALKAASVTVFDDTIKYNYMIRDNSHSMAAFNQKYMNTLILTKKMIEVCLKEMPVHTNEARAFDFNTNMVVLNMLLIESRKLHQADYEILVTNLRQYNGFFIRGKGISQRYRWGYALFLLSPVLYTSVLRAYSAFTNSEHLNRKQKSGQLKTA